MSMETEHEHTPQAIAARLGHGPDASYVRDWIYGGIDGAITTFAIVAGVVGANLSAGVVLVLGFANLLADGFSMAASNYSGTKAELDDYKRIRRIEEKHIERNPLGEREEIRQIYAAKGLAGAELEGLVDAITSRRDLWIDTMLTEEYGLSLARRSPVRAALVTFAAFVVCGLVPLLPFAIGLEASAAMASVMTGLVFFVIGAAKSRWSTQHWIVGGLETAAIGLAAAGVAYLVGHLLGGVLTP